MFTNLQFYTLLINVKFGGVGGQTNMKQLHFGWMDLYEFSTNSSY